MNLSVRIYTFNVLFCTEKMNFRMEQKQIESLRLCKFLTFHTKNNTTEAENRCMQYENGPVEFSHMHFLRTIWR